MPSKLPKLASPPKRKNTRRHRNAVPKDDVKPMLKQVKTMVTNIDRLSTKVEHIPSDHRYTVGEALSLARESFGIALKHLEQAEQKVNIPSRDNPLA